MSIVKKMVLPSIRVSEKFKKETVECAMYEQENISEYMRLAIAERNKDILSKIRCNSTGK